MALVTSTTVPPPTAETTIPEIRVYAPFPHTVALGPDLNLDPSNWHWVHCLTLPLDTLAALQFSYRPYKWMRYAIGVIIGAEGDLSPSRDLPNVVDYNAVLPTESIVLYYHTSDEDKRRMFPLSPKNRRATITSSIATDRRATFRGDVAQRDGFTCALSNMPDSVCDAVHLVAHSKGDTYITNYTRHRSRDPTGDDIVEDIDSVRNGLFLNVTTHRVLGTHVAFLMTPNFALTTADIDLTAPLTKKRCTAHAFKVGFDSLGALGSRGGRTVLSGSPLRISNTPEWPPAILFDIVYADAVMYHFGTQELTQEVTSSAWEDAFYPDGVTTASDADYKEITNARAATATRTQNQAQERELRYKTHRGRRMVDIMALPYILVPPNELRAVFREANEKVAAAEQRRVQEKVGNWMKQINGPL